MPNSTITNLPPADGLSSNDNVLINQTTTKKASVSLFSALAPTGLLIAKGDLASFSTVIARLPVGTDGQMLTADSGETLGIKWS